jgi:hypothetical protein
MDTHTDANVKLLLSPRQSRGITYWIYCQKIIYYKDAALAQRQMLGAAKLIGNSMIDARVKSTRS